VGLILLISVLFGTVGSFHDEKGIWPVETCITYPQTFYFGTPERNKSHPDPRKK